MTAERTAALKARIEAEHPVRSLDKRAREIEATGVPLMEAYRRAVDGEVERRNAPRNGPVSIATARGKQFSVVTG